MTEEAQKIIDEARTLRGSKRYSVYINDYDPDFYHHNNFSSIIGRLDFRWQQLIARRNWLIEQKKPAPPFPDNPQYLPTRGDEVNAAAFRIEMAVDDEGYYIFPDGSLIFDHEHK